MSPDWKEVVAPDEPRRFDALARTLTGIQQDVARRQGAVSRALHARGHLGLKASLRVREGLPAWARVGPFATGGVFKGWLRLSNGSAVHQSDRVGDVRGFALKLTGVDGAKLIPGMESAPTWDLLGILSQSMPFKTPDAFVAVVRAANGPKLLALPRILSALGLSAFSALGQLQAGLKMRIDSLVEQSFYSVLPIRWGDAAVKYGFAPVTPPLPARPVTDEARRYAADVKARLETGPLRWVLRVQPFLDERTTPIEDPTVVWPSEWIDVADLEVPTQDPESEAGKALSALVETFSFDPWHAPVEFRPLGAMMRARSHAYRDSTRARSAAPEPGPERW